MLFGDCSFLTDPVPTNCVVKGLLETTRRFAFRTVATL